MKYLKLLFSIWSIAVYVDLETLIALNSQQVILENIYKLEKEKSFCNPFFSFGKDVKKYV